MPRKHSDPYTHSHTWEPNPEMPLEVLDSSGKPLLVMPMDAVLRQKLGHKAVLACLRDRAGRIFIHRLPSVSARYPGMWDIAAAGRLFVGESYHDAGLRLLHANWDIANVELHEVPCTPEVFEGPAKTRLRLFVSSRMDVLPKRANGETVDGMFADEDELAAVIRDFSADITPALFLAVSRLLPITSLPKRDS